MIKVNMNNIPKESNFKPENVNKFVEIYKSNDLKIEQNDMRLKN
ncbi:MAG: hypothetical protein ACFE9V_18805 [Candidatus Hodarchaeota archaeon]